MLQAVILSNNTIRSVLINQAKIMICSVAPAFPLLAATRAGFRLIVTEQFDKVRFFFHKTDF